MNLQAGEAAWKLMSVCLDRNCGLCMEQISPSETTPELILLFSQLTYACFFTMAIQLELLLPTKTGEETLADVPGTPQGSGDTEPGCGLAPVWPL